MTKYFAIFETFTAISSEIDFNIHKNKSLCKTKRAFSKIYNNFLHLQEKNNDNGRNGDPGQRLR